MRLRSWAGAAAQ
uniref:Uncharacterized protein n=1 Tax=Macrostomum lignano TaxID=282301 RepID=A0A1I8JKZ4_9PLAT